ncbi:MAG: hypothetical protein FWG38_10730, partial [Defluviitaleaceae bacterium]|nr:hypothetical protein [Defluviitaleaceae bacterium]
KPASLASCVYEMERSLHNCRKRSTIASFMIALTTFQPSKAIITIYAQWRIRICVFFGLHLLKIF